MAAHSREVYSIEQPVQLLHREFDHRSVLARPNEACILQPLLQQPESIAAPAKDLDSVFPAVAKDEHGLGKRIESEFVLNHGRQAVDVLAKVNLPSVQVHRKGGVQMKHGNCAKLRSTLPRASAFR